MPKAYCYFNVMYNKGKKWQKKLCQNTMWKCQNIAQCFTFSWISWVDWASQKATVATSFKMGISMVQSRPSRSATSGRGCIGPFIIGGLIPAQRRGRLDSVLLMLYNSSSMLPVSYKPLVNSLYFLSRFCLPYEDLFFNIDWPGEQYIISDLTYLL